MFDDDTYDNSQPGGDDDNDSVGLGSGFHEVGTADDDGFDSIDDDKDELTSLEMEGDADIDDIDADDDVEDIGSDDENDTESNLGTEEDGEEDM